VTTAVVVGGGVAGLTAARDLAVAGLTVTVLDAATTPGGCVASVQVSGLPDGLLLDGGAESFATRTSAVADLLREVGLGQEIVQPRRLGSWAQHPDGPVPLPAAGLLGIPVDPWAADVRQAVGVLGCARAWLDRVLPARVGLPDGPVTVAHLVRARMGRRVLDRLVAPVVTGVHSHPPDVLDLDTAIPGIREGLRATGSLAGAVAGLRERAPAGAAAAGLRGGLHRMVAALADDLVRHGGRVETGVAVHAIVQEPSGWSVRTDDGALATDVVVLAVPGSVAVRLLEPWVSLELPTPAPVSIVSLVLDAPALDRAPRGTGVLVAAGTPVAAKGLTHATAKWEWLAEAAQGLHVVRLSYGRGPHVGGGPGGLLDGVPDGVPDTALADASVLLGTDLARDRLRGWARTDWPLGLGAPTPGHRDRVAAMRRALPDGLHVTGAWAAGTGLAAVVADARGTAAAVVADVPDTGAARIERTPRP
jgi:oxygen-dependent protoporphyrinogen oxidase